MPVPERLAVCGLPLALSVMLTEAVRLPLAAGVNVTLMVQLALAATELPQVLAWAKSLALAPVRARLVMLNEALPVLVSVTVWAVLVLLTVWFPKARLRGERLTTGAGTLVPVPDKLTVCVLPAVPLLLSVTISVPARAPVAAEVKVTAIVQLAPAATALPQAFVWAKSPALVPVTVMLAILNAALPVLVSVTVWAALVVLIVWFPKERLLGAMLATGAGAGGGSIAPAPPPQATCHAAARITDRAKTRALLLGSFLLSALAAYVFMMEQPLVGSSAESVGKKKAKEPGKGYRTTLRILSESCKGSCELTQIPQERTEGASRVF